jgi:hypothetical protein
MIITCLKYIYIWIERERERERVYPQPTVYRLVAGYGNETSKLFS